MKLKYNSEQWCKLTGIVVIDPDGWDRKGNFQADWHKSITLDEFLEKCIPSTTSGTRFRKIEEVEKIVLENLGYKL